MGDASHSPPASAQDVDSKRQRKGHPLPANFQPNAEHKALADQLGLSLQTEQALFVDHHKAKGGTSQDWNASFRSWLRRAERFKGKTGNKKGYFRTDSADVDYWDGVTPDGRF
jgi:hypothetical protein